MQSEVEQHGNWRHVIVKVPPRLNGLPNEACAIRVQQAVDAINPAAFDPITPQVAEAVRVPRANFPPFDLPADYGSEAPSLTVTLDQSPPNCDGCNAAVDPRAINPPVDPEQEDDTGEPYVVPGCATGTRGLD